MAETMTELLLGLRETERLTFYHDDRLPGSIAVRFEHWPREGNQVFRRERAFAKDAIHANARRLVSETHNLLEHCRQLIAAGEV